MFKEVVTVFLCVIMVVSCKKNSPVVCNDEVGLHQVARYPIGVAIDYNEFTGNAVYRSKVDKQFSSITAENIFKPAELHPDEFTFNWINADSLCNYAYTTNKRLHGHTLIWHKQLPYWMENYTGSAEEWEQMMKVHITTIVRHFKGKVTSWDVVNEAFNEDGTLRNTIWRQHIGDAYIEKAFAFAREADPDALLFYNDYNLEFNPQKRKSVIALFKTLSNRGVAVSGIGLQMHISIYYPEISQIADAFKEFSDNGYKIHISEMDISQNPFHENIGVDVSLSTAQAGRYSAVVLQYNQVPERYRYGITFWGVSDRNSWLRTYFSREDYPLLYDDNYLPKQAYCKLFETLQK